MKFFRSKWCFLIQNTLYDVFQLNRNVAIFTPTIFALFRPSSPLQYSKCVMTRLDKNSSIITEYLHFSVNIKTSNGTIKNFVHKLYMTHYISCSNIIDTMHTHLHQKQDESKNITFLHAYILTMYYILYINSNYSQASITFNNFSFFFFHAYSLLWNISSIKWKILYSFSL